MKMEDMKKYKEAWEWACSETKNQAIKLRERAATLRREAITLEEIAMDLDSIRIQELYQ
jgi:hypothetical protein